MWREQVLLHMHPLAIRSLTNRSRSQHNSTGGSSEAYHCCLAFQHCFADISHACTPHKDAHTYTTQHLVCTQSNSSNSPEHPISTFCAALLSHNLQHTHHLATKYQHNVSNTHSKVTVSCHYLQIYLLLRRAHQWPVTCEALVTCAPRLTSGACAG